MATADNQNPRPDSFDSGIYGTIPFSGGWINVHHGLIVQASYNDGSDPKNVNMNKDLMGLPSRVSSIENITRAMSFNDSTGRLVLNGMESGAWQERIVAGPTGATIKAGPQNLITANNSTFELKANSDVVISANSTEMKLSHGNRFLSLKGNTENTILLQFDGVQYLSMTATETNLTYKKGDQSSSYLGKAIKISDTGVNLYAHPYQAWVSTSQGHGGDPSDRRFKKDITYDVDGDILDDLKPVRYKFKTADVERYGFIAQDVQEVIPSIVNTAPEGDRLYLHYNDIIAILTAKVQKQSKKIQDLEDRIAKLEALVLDKVKE
jgi:hypothetical protein